MVYQQNYIAWSKQTAELLKAGRFTELDIEHLLQELEGMGASEKNEIESRLVVLLAHLLKWQYQYQQLSERWKEFKGDSWRSMMIEQRARLSKRLQKSPGLKSIFAETITEAYQDAIELAAEETGLPETTFPQQCPYSHAQILDKTFYPEHV
jgi:hypothetical protein